MTRLSSAREMTDCIASPDSGDRVAQPDRVAVQTKTIANVVFTEPSR
ncbi:hypothetical protein BN2877_35480 [Achromobacter xylosoxidans]|nr:hypothetical protein BN2877_35480 [Achromobacter xylosoxidans]